MAKKISISRFTCMWMVWLVLASGLTDIADGSENIWHTGEQQKTDGAAANPASNEITEQDCSAVSYHPIDPQLAESEVLAAAQNDFASFLKFIPENSESKFGFQDKEDLEQAQLGITAYQMFTRCEGVDYPTNAWRVPIYSGPEARVFLTVDWVDDSWQVVGVGGAEFAEKVLQLDSEKTLRMAAPVQLHRILIRDYLKRTDFLLLKPHTIDLQREQAVLDFPEVIQEQDEWCWAGVSAALFEYFDNPVEQCEIAEYTRSVATWYDFGSTDCCIDPEGDCNYGNYNWGSAGSIEDILENMQESIEISNYGIGREMYVAEIDSDLDQDLPFIIRWGWNTGGGHFLVGFGLDDNPSDAANPYMHYLDPWFGEGNHIDLYLWVCSGGTHTWTHTNRLIGVSMHGDVDGSKHLELSDAVVALQLITAAPTAAPLFLSADVNGDLQIGMEEVLYLLRALAE